MTRKESKKGDHNVFQAGSMMIKFYQNNYHHIKGAWTGEDESDYTEYEEIKDSWTLRKGRKEEPNYFQTGRFLKRILDEEWFEELRTDKRFTCKWREQFVDNLMESEWKDVIGEAWMDKDRRETLKGYIVGSLKDAGVICGKYDEIAKVMGYEEDYRTFSSYLGRGKKQPFFDWICVYVKGKE
jgi:hypothetical protein